MSITKPLTTNALNAIPPYVFWELDAKRAALKARGKKLVDFGIGSPDQPVPPPVVEALRAAVGEKSLSGYPHFSGDPAYLQAVSTFMMQRFGVSLDVGTEVLSVAGTKEGLAEIVLALCNPGDVVLVPEIHYPVYARAALLAGAVPVFMPIEKDTGRLMLEKLSATDIARARVMIVNYPCNPTTAIASREELAKLVAFAESNALLLVSDLAYSELSYDGYVVPSMLEIPGAKEVTVEMHSCSKSFNMAGLRIGFVCGNADAIGAPRSVSLQRRLRCFNIAAARRCRRVCQFPRAREADSCGVHASAATPSLRRSSKTGGTPRCRKPPCTCGWMCPRASTTGAGWTR